MSYFGPILVTDKQEDIQLYTSPHAFEYLIYSWSTVKCNIHALLFVDFVKRSFFSCYVSEFT